MPKKPPPAIPPDTMRDFSNQKHLGRVKDQSLTDHLLIINIPSREHESAIRYFDKLLDGKLEEVRPKLPLEMKACGATDVQGTTSRIMKTVWLLLDEPTCMHHRQSVRRGRTTRLRWTCLIVARAFLPFSVFSGTSGRPLHENGPASDRDRSVG
jgi:hypothetical protein